MKYIFQNATWLSRARRFRAWPPPQLRRSTAHSPSSADFSWFVKRLSMAVSWKQNSLILLFPAKHWRSDIFNEKLWTLDKLRQENSHLHYNWKNHCMANLLFDWTGFNQTSKFIGNGYAAMQLNPKRTNWRSAIQCYFVLQIVWGIFA